jgi:hypothetical protein
MNKTYRPIRFPEALDKEGNRIHIDKAPRGRKGYRCTGCKKDVEAIKPIGNKQRPYFRHVAKDVDISKSECTYASETYRHKLAKEALVEEKSIRVPRVLKYPPKGIDSDARVVAGPRTITAYRVDIEKSFYVNNQGLLKYGPKSDESIVEPDKHFLIVPDVIFFDRNDKPILFIELVATHDIDDIKLAKIRALKIDTVRVRLPIESAEAIRECFKITERTKWIYNNERERADYFELPRSTTERISGADRYEAGLSDESTRCRKSRIGNLIRGIRRGLESNGFGEATEKLKREISEIEGKLSDRKRIESEIDVELYKSLGGRREEIRNRQAKLKRVSEWLEERYKILRGEIELRGSRRFGERRREIKNEEVRIERLYPKVRERYERKRKALESEESDLNGLIGSSEAESRVDGREFIRTEQQIEGEIERIGNSILVVERDIATVRGEMETIQGDFERERSQLETNFRIKTNELDRNSKQSEKRENDLIQQFTNEAAELPGRIDIARTEIRERFERLEREALDTIKRRYTEGDSQLSRQIKELVSTGRILSDYTTALKSFERYGEALRYIKTESFKTWLNSRGDTSTNSK